MINRISHVQDSRHALECIVITDLMFVQFKQIRDECHTLLSNISKEQCNQLLRLQPSNKSGTDLYV